MPGNLFRLQLAAALRDRRQIVLRIAVSCLLALPFVFVGMPPRAQVSGIVMVILFTGFFGAAISHAHLRADLRLARLCLLATPRPILWLDLVLSSTLVRLGPSAVILTGFVVINGRNVSPADLLNLAGLLCAALVLLTLLGIATGRLARSNAEVHLFGALATGALALLCGIAPLPERLAWLEATLPWNPVARLLTALTELSVPAHAAPASEIGFSLTMMSAVVTVAAMRWIAGGMKQSAACNVPDVVADERASMEVQTE